MNAYSSVFHVCGLSVCMYTTCMHIRVFMYVCLYVCMCVHMYVYPGGVQTLRRQHKVERGHEFSKHFLLLRCGLLRLFFQVFPLALSLSLSRFRSCSLARSLSRVPSLPRALSLARALSLCRSLSRAHSLALSLSPSHSRSRSLSRFLSFFLSLALSLLSAAASIRVTCLIMACLILTCHTASFLCVIPLTHIYNRFECVRVAKSYIRITRPIHMCDMAHLYV